MMMGVRCCSDIFGLSSLLCQFMLNSMNPRLAPLYLGHLSNKVSTICSIEPSFGAAMFKFTLKTFVRW